MYPQRFTDRVSLVTGAASGIGRATALRLAAEGATVFASDVATEGLLETASLAADSPGTITTTRSDVADEASVQALVAEAVDRYGRLDVVVNVAGVLAFSHSHEFALSEWNRLLTINLTGTFLVCREALPHLVESKGVIVNLASTSAHRGQPWSAAYSASKGGVLALTRTLAVEYAAQGVRVNSVSPGAIETPIMEAFQLPEGADFKLLRRVMPIGPNGKPEGIAAAIAFIASDEASHMNGADLLVDGATVA
jgi:meso-butanediol dehydrogenase/(S,S)-butanediol dehydrogenase/diacetyl reductase